MAIPLKIIDLQNDFNILVAKQWKIRISVPMSYIKFIIIVINLLFDYYVSQSDLQLSFTTIFTIIMYSPIFKL